MSQDNPFFECSYADYLEMRRKQRTIKAREIGKRKRIAQLLRNGKVNVRAIVESHNSVTTIVIRELE